ncbi:hypothetical protein [Azospirillum argentinense]
MAQRRRSDPREESFIADIRQLLEAPAIVAAAEAMAAREKRKPAQVPATR